MEAKNVLKLKKDTLRVLTDPRDTAQVVGGTNDQRPTTCDPTCGMTGNNNG